jgi:hypothetical protein
VLKACTRNIKNIKIYFPHNILRFVHQKWQQQKGKEINIFKSLARSNVFSTKSEEQEVNLVWPNLCIFWLPFICLYRSWSWSLPNFVGMNISGYQNYKSSLLTGFRAEKNYIFRCWTYNFDIHWYSFRQSSEEIMIMSGINRWRAVKIYRD